MLKSAVLTDMLGIVRERNEKYQSVLVREFLNPEMFEEPIVTGIFSQTFMASRRRFLRQDNVLTLAPELVETPTTIARDYLDVAFPRRPRCTGEQAELFSIPISAPLFYKPYVSKDAVYVDLSKAYWYIMGVIGWDVDYHPGKYLSPGRPPRDFPFYEHKVARNSLVSSAQEHTTQMWTGYKWTENKMYNRHLNRGLYHAIMDILHAIARDAILYGACYIATDGYIMDASKVGFLEEALTEHWKIPYTVKGRGATIVTGIGSYRVGEHRTQKLRVQFDKPYSNVNMDSNRVVKYTFPMIVSDRLHKPWRLR